MLLGVFCALAFVPTAHAATASAPRSALLHAQSAIHLIASQASKGSAQNAAAADAAGVLAGASAPTLWIDARDSVAPSYGSRIFADSAAALSDLQRLKRSFGHRVGADISLIVGADRALAADTISRASGANPQLLAAAKHALAVGDGQAGRGRYGSAVRSYTTAWQDAFNALAQLMSADATSMPSADLTTGAEQALGSKKISLAGPKMPHGLPPLTRAGKPELLFIGSEACPFCAVQRWGMIVALSQFGTFSHLHLMQSDTTEQPAVRTFTFFGSSYQSPYFSFDPVEAVSNVRQGLKFEPLERLSHSQSALLNRFDPGFETPFIDIANRFITVQSTVQPTLLGGLYWTQIASSLTQPTSIPAQAIAGEAEVMTAELCEATNGNPQSVCSSPAVAQYEAALPLLNGMGGGCPVTGATTAVADFERAPGPPFARPARRCGT